MSTVVNVIELVVGQKFNLDACIQSGQDVYQVAGEIIYPSELLDVERRADDSPVIVAGKFLASPSDCVAAFDEEQPGKIRVSYVLAGQVPTVYGSGTLWTLHMTALQPGAGAIAWGAGSTVANKEKYLPATFVDQEFNVAEVPPPDEGVNVVYFVIRP